MDIMSTSIQIIYVTGMIAALIVAIVDLIINTSKDEIEKSQFGMIAPMMLLSWITVICYLYGKIRHKKSIN